MSMESKGPASQRSRGQLTHRRASAVAAGVALVLVPTLFTLFPHWSNWALTPKLLVLAGWFVAAFVVIRAGVGDSERIRDLLGTVHRRREAGREAASRFILRELLSPDAAGFPAHYEFRLFLPDEHRQRLLPEYESPGRFRSEGWEIGQGATGAAWSSGSYVRVRGATVSDGTYGLTPEQQERYRDLLVVAAAPVLNARAEPIAVLSVSSDIDDGFLFEGDGPELHKELAQAVARVLIDISGIGGD